jgi:hypothetical protein
MYPDTGGAGPCCPAGTLICQLKLWLVSGSAKLMLILKVAEPTLLGQ